jgi:hypothetical protein
MVGPVLIGWTRFWPKMTVLTRNGMKLIFYPGQHGLTRIDSVDSVLMERCSWLEKNIFLNFKLFLNFFGFFMNNNRNKITFKKILVNQKLSYNSGRNMLRVTWFSTYNKVFFIWLIVPLMLRGNSQVLALHHAWCQQKDHQFNCR